ncbi:hypothetical protein GGU11DRAFT_788861 [Lentinula aff. detonsa]|nr:hypothetical protein GGU11DRAFT_788861 [Lentinula aff. detonsa]
MVVRTPKRFTMSQLKFSYNHSYVAHIFVGRFIYHCDPGSSWSVSNQAKGKRHRKFGKSLVVAVAIYIRQESCNINSELCSSYGHTGCLNHLLDNDTSRKPRPVIVVVVVVVVVGRPVIVVGGPIVVVGRPTAAPPGKGISRAKFVVFISSKIRHVGLHSTLVRGERLAFNIRHRDLSSGD